jgi:hypothetical protein
MAEELKAAEATRKQFNEDVTAALVEDELIRSAVLLLLIAEELGPEGCWDTGFYDTLVKFTARLLAKVPKAKERFRLLQRCRDMTDAEVAERIQKMIETMEARRDG